MKYLIVNADDYHIDSRRNRGILEARKKGIVTSTTVLVHPGLEGNWIQELTDAFGPRVGIHLNLSEGSPFTAGLKTLVSPAGQFLGKWGTWRKALMRGFDLGEVEEELTRQLLRFQATGATPDHLDAHNHIHIFPGIVEVVARIARRFDILRIRLPHEPFSSWRQCLEGCAFKKGWIGSLSRRAGTVFKREGLRSSDRFAGIQFPDVSRVSSTLRFLQNLPDGTTELMCHPGYRDPSGNPFSNADRERELFSLIDASVLEEVQRLGIHLISYGDLEP